MVLGYLGGTPELKFTNDGKAVARFSVAVNEKWKDSEGAPQERVECMMWIGNEPYEFLPLCFREVYVPVIGLNVDW